MNAEAARARHAELRVPNPTGLPARGHHSSAHDLGVLAKAIITSFPDYYGLYAEREFSYNGIAQHNRNALLWRDPTVDGMKTGFTDGGGLLHRELGDSRRHAADRRRAGRKVAEDPQRRRRRRCSITASRTTRRTGSTRPARRSAPRASGAAQSEAAQLGLTHDVFVTIPRGRYDALAASMDVIAQLVAAARARHAGR